MWWSKDYVYIDTEFEATYFVFNAPSSQEYIAYIGKAHTIFEAFANMDENMDKNT